MSETVPCYRLRRAVRYRIIDLEAVVVRQDSAEVMVLNEVGARVLVLLDRRQSPSVIAEILPTEFEVTLEDARRDVQHYIDELLEAGIIELATDTAVCQGQQTAPAS